MYIHSYIDIPSKKEIQVESFYSLKSLHTNAQIRHSYTQNKRKIRNNRSGIQFRRFHTKKKQIKNALHYNTIPATTLFTRGKAKTAKREFIAGITRPVTSTWHVSAQQSKIWSDSILRLEVSFCTRRQIKRNVCSYEYGRNIQSPWGSSAAPRGT